MTTFLKAMVEVAAYFAVCVILVHVVGVVVVIKGVGVLVSPVVKPVVAVVVLPTDQGAFSGRNLMG